MTKTAIYYQPKPSPISFAMWEYLGRLTMPTRPMAGIRWGAYIGCGGPARYLGRG